VCRSTDPRAHRPDAGCQARERSSPQRVIANRLRVARRQFAMPKDGSFIRATGHRVGQDSELRHV
jgi:hypothetical protein